MAGSKLKSSLLGMVCLASIFCVTVAAQTTGPKFRVMAFYTGQDEPAHISFVNEAKQWFPRMAAERGFSLMLWNGLAQERKRHTPPAIDRITTPNV
jgi:hypothetical protein